MPCYNLYIKPEVEHMKKKAIALLLTASMALSLAGCSLGGSKIGPKKLAAYGKDSGAELYEDADDWEEDMEDIAKDSDWASLDDGVYINAKDKDIKSVFSTFEMEGLKFYDKSMTEATTYFMAEEKNDKRVTVLASSYVFESKDDALDFYEDWTDNLEDQYKSDKISFDVDFDTFEEGNMEYALFAEDNHASFAVGIYVEGKTVLLVFGAGSELKTINKNIDDVCDAMGVVPPSDL